MIDFHKGNFKSEQLFFFVFEHTLTFSPRLFPDECLLLNILVVKWVEIETLISLL